MNRRIEKKKCERERKNDEGKKRKKGCIEWKVRKDNEEKLEIKKIEREIMKDLREKRRKEKIEWRKNNGWKILWKRKKEKEGEKKREVMKKMGRKWKGMMVRERI